MNLAAWSQELADHLASLVNPDHEPGTPWPVAVSDDERDLSLPGVWFGITQIRPTLSGTTCTVDWTVIVLASATSPREAVRQLGALAAPIAAAYQPAQMDALPISAGNLTPEPIPALRFTISTDCED